MSAFYLFRRGGRPKQTMSAFLTVFFVRELPLVAIFSGKKYSRICALLSANPPVTFRKASKGCTGERYNVRSKAICQYWHPLPVTGLHMFSLFSRVEGLFLVSSLDCYFSNICMSHTMTVMMIIPICEM